MYSGGFMKNSCNCVVCFGLILLAGGGFMLIYTAPYLSDPDSWLSLFGGDDTVLVMAISAIVALLGLVLVFVGYNSTKNWNRVVAIAKSQNQISLKELSVKAGVPVEKVSSIIYEAIGSGELAGTIEGESFSKSRPSVAAAPTGEAKVLVICPYCGAKTEQGLAKCQKCGADI